MNEFDQINEVLKSMFSPERLEEIGDMTRRLGVLDAIVANETLDPDVLATWLFHDKMQILPVEAMKEIVNIQIPILIAEGLIVDGEPTDEARLISMMHTAMLNEGVTIQ